MSGLLGAGLGRPRRFSGHSGTRFGVVPEDHAVESDVRRAGRGSFLALSVRRRIKAQLEVGCIEAADGSAVGDRVQLPLAGSRIRWGLDLLFHGYVPSATADCEQ